MRIIEYKIVFICKFSRDLNRLLTTFKVVPSTCSEILLIIVLIILIPLLILIILMILQFGWTHVTLLIIVTQSHLIVQNVLEGFIWYEMLTVWVLCGYSRKCAIMLYLYFFFVVDNSFFFVFLSLNIFLAFILSVYL